MIIGIDDSGDFETHSQGMYAAVFIRPKKAEHIKRKFEEWESRLPVGSKDERGEVKGWMLSKDQLLDFARSIMNDNGYGQIKHHVFAIPVGSDSQIALEKQRQKHLVQYQAGIDEYREQGKEFFAIAGFYIQLSEWLTKRSMKSLAKLELLSFTVYRALNLAIITSTVRHFDKELGKLTIKIDEGLVGRPSTKAYWQDSLRSAVWNFSRQEGIIHVKEWQSGHPFLKRFYQYPKSTETLGVFSDEIRKCMDFYDSKDHFEIRIADIVASTYFRTYVQKEDLYEVIKALRPTQIVFKGSYTLLQLGMRDDADKSNPYTDRINGVTLEEIRHKYGDV